LVSLSKRLPRGVGLARQRIARLRAHGARFAHRARVRLHELLLTGLVALAGCGADRGPDDQGVLVKCPPGAAELHGAKCDPRVDTACDCSAEADCYTARCLCDGYWEADLVLRICDGGGADLSIAD
jgi:hypothetical protein